MVILTTSQLKQISEMMYVVNITFFKDKQEVDLTWLGTVLTNTGASLVAQTAMQETGFWPLGQEDPLEKGITTHFSILAWRIPWTEEPGRLYSPWAPKDLDMTERLTHASFHLACCLYTFSYHISITVVFRTVLCSRHAANVCFNWWYNIIVRKRNLGPTSLSSDTSSCTY